MDGEWRYGFGRNVSDYPGTSVNLLFCIRAIIHGELSKSSPEMQTFEAITLTAMKPFLFSLA